MIKLEAEYINYYINAIDWFLKNYFNKTSKEEFIGYYLERLLERIEGNYSKLLNKEDDILCSTDELYYLKEAVHYAKEDYKENNLDKTVLVEIDNYLRNLT